MVGFGWKEKKGLRVNIKMLQKSHISNIEIHSDAWFSGRLGKFTSSMIFVLMGEKPFTTGAMSYIMEKAGEEMSGMPAKQEVDNEWTRWGHIHEGTAVHKFGKKMKIDFLVVQKLITAPGSRFGSTPDAIWVKKAYRGAYDVSTVEVKCYPSYSHFISCVLCDTPEELKRIDPKLYWQVIDQMCNCDCLVGYAVLFHPLFKAGGFKIIEFRKVLLVPEFTFLIARKNMAVTKFEEIRDRLLKMK